jgi:uncharacterized protein involved in exopolysaccharide biosynthesis
VLKRVKGLYVLLRYRIMIFPINITSILLAVAVAVTTFCVYKSKSDTL